TRSPAPTLSAGDVMMAPFTATRPAAIQVSASRREASPARAMTLATRSFTSPRRGEVGSRSDPDEGACGRPAAPNPLTPTLSPPGRGSPTEPRSPSLPFRCECLSRLRGLAELIDNGAPDSRRGGVVSFMDEALEQARAAVAAGEVPIGCVIVRDGAV